MHRERVSIARSRIVKQRRGFTLIEILVACSVMVILMGLLFMGGRAIINTQREKRTKAALSNLRALMTEREAAIGASKFKTEVEAIFAATPALIANNPSP